MEFGRIYKWFTDNMLYIEIGALVGLLFILLFIIFKFRKLRKHEERYEEAEKSRYGRYNFAGEETSSYSAEALETRTEIEEHVAESSMQTANPIDDNSPLEPIVQEEKVSVSVDPFRAALFITTTAEYDEPLIKGTDYLTIRNIKGKSVLIDLMGDPGTEAVISLAGFEKYSRAVTIITIIPKDVSTQVGASGNQTVL